MHKTGNLNYERAIYGITSVNSDENVRHFKKEISSKSGGCNLHTDLVKVEKDNGYHDSSRFFENFLYFRTDTNWNRCSKTGLALTQFSNVFEGNISRFVELHVKTNKGKDFETPNHWVVVQLLNDNKIMVVDIFRDFYPVSPDLRKAILNEHKLYKQ